MKVVLLFSPQRVEAVFFFCRQVFFSANVNGPFSLVKSVC